MEVRTPFWREFGDALARRYAHSAWALFGLVGAALVPLALLYMVRGVRMVRYGVVGAVGAVGVALAFAYPYPTLLVSLFTAYSRLDERLPGPVAWVLLAIATGRVLYDWFGGKPLEWGTRNFRVATALFLAAVLTSLLFAYDMESATGHLWHLVIGLMMYIAISGLCTSPRRVQQLLLVFSAAFSFQVARYVMTLISAFGSGIVLQPTGNRLSPGEANQTAVIATCLLVPLVQLMGHVSVRKRLLIAPLALIHVVAVIISASRIGMLLLAIASAYLLLRSRRRVLYLALVAVALVIFFVNVPARYWTRFVALGQLTDLVVDRSLLLRLRAQEVGWTIFMDHFWTGVGIGNFGAWSQRYMLYGVRAHNSFLDVAATLGIFGFAIYVFWLTSGIQMLVASAKRLRRAGSALGWTLSLDLAGVLALFLIASVTLDLAYTRLMWIWWGCVNALYAWALSAGPKPDLAGRVRLG